MADSVTTQIQNFAGFVLEANGWTASAAVTGTAVALSATGLDLGFSRNGMCTAFGFPDKIVKALGFRTTGNYSDQLTAQIAAAVTVNGTQWQWCPTAWKGTPEPNKHVLNALQKGSLAYGDLAQVKKALKPKGGTVGVGGTAGINKANDGWATFRDFVSTGGPNIYGRINAAHNHIKGVRS